MSDQYVRELLEEKDSLDHDTHIHSIRLLENEIFRVTGRKVEDENKETDNSEPSNNRKPKYRSYTGAVVSEETVKLTEKVIVPVKEYPKFNFVGKLLGPRGNTLKRLQQATQTHMSVLGRGSTRDKEKEEELRNSGEAKYEHLKEPLHVLIEVEGPKSEAHARLAGALLEIKKYMTPENDEIRQEQMREMALLKGGAEKPVGPTVVVAGGRGRGFPANGAPIIRVGIPPPGSIILNSAALGAAVRSGRPLVRGGRRPIQMPRHAASAPDRYSYDAYDTTYDATYEGYPETEEPVYYEYPDDYASGERIGSKRSTHSAIPYRKKFRTDPPSYPSPSYPSQRERDRF